MNRINIYKPLFAIALLITSSVQISVQVITETAGKLSLKVHLTTTMKNFITFLLLLANINLYSQAILSVEIIAKEGDAVGTSFLENIRNPVTNPQGQVGFTFERTDDVDGMWFDDAPIFDETQDVNVSGDFEGSSGIGIGGKFLISSKFNNADAVYNQDGLVLVEDTQAPGFDAGVNTTFHSRSFMSGDNNNYWVAGLNFTGGTSTENRVLYQLVNDIPTPVYSTKNLVVEGFTLQEIGGIDFDYFVSNNNQHLIHLFLLNTGSDTDDAVMVLNGTTIVASENSPTNITGHNWDNFDVMTINNDGDYLFTGDTDGNTSEDEFIAFNGNIVIQEGDTLDGIPLESLTLNNISLNDAGTVGFVLIANNQEHFFISDIQDVKGNARLIASVGDSLDVNNDGAVDFTITDFNSNTSFGNSLDLSNNDFAFLELDISQIGASTEIEAIVKFCFTGQEIIFVDKDAPGTNDGTSWANAFTDLQDAIDNASSPFCSAQTVWVAEGTYLPTKNESGNLNPTQPRNKTFSLNADSIQLFGGFVGTETLLSERDISANPTILSGDLGIANDTIDNAFRVLTMNGENSLTSATRIDGFFVQDANNSGEGGGLFIFVDAGVQKEPTIANCIFRNNIASRGAAILNTGKSTIQAPNNPGTVSPIFINCAFFDNHATGSIKSFAFGGQGFPNNGGVVSSKMIFVNALSRPSVINCSFSGNQGGAFSTNGNTISTLENCIFWDNENLEITTIEGSSATLNFSILDDGNPNGTINFPASTTGNNNLDSDPLFVDAANGNLRLQENSPAINAGDNTANPLALDIDGNPRIAFDTIDIGAFETIDPCFIDIIAPVPDLANLPNATGQCSVTLTAPTATDDCDGLITGTTTDPTTYTEQGTFTVTWSYEDNIGNTNSQQQIVMIDDTSVPLLLLVDSTSTLLPDAIGECEVILTIPKALDNCEGLIFGTTDDPLTYNTAGTFTVTWTFDDSNGNSITKDQTVIVTDVTAPVPNVTTLPNATGQCSVTVTAPKATDNCKGQITATTTNPTTYTQQGTFTVTWTYNDGNGNTSSQQQTIIVTDVTAPVPNVTTLPNATGQCSVTVTAPKATDNCKGQITATTTNPTTYTQQGTFTVTWTYNDENGNTSSQQQTVIIKDVTAPTIALNGGKNITLDCAVTEYNDEGASAQDNCDGVTVETSGAVDVNTPGSYSITYKAIDVAGNESSLLTRTVVVPTIEVCNNCQDNLVLPENRVIVSDSYLAKQMIIASGVIESGSSVTFTAGESITLSSGFRVQTGATFNAAISEIACSTEALIAENKLHLTAPETAISNTIREVVTLSVQPNPFQSANLQFKVFPNPTNADTKIYIELPNPTTLSIQLFDQSGRLLQQLLPQQEKSTGVFQLDIPISQLPIGMNYIILQTNERRVVRKLIRIR